MSHANSTDLLNPTVDQSVATKIADRLSQELVIALVGPVGSGVSTAAGLIRDILNMDYAYDVAPIIKPSDIIRSEAHRVGLTPPAREHLNQYILEMQSAGNALREKFGNDYLSEKTVEIIYKYRRDRGGYSSNNIQLPGRRAYIIDSLKNPEELVLLRQIYGETLCVFGVFAPDSMRKIRLKNDGVPDGDVEKIMDRDRGEVPTFGQKTRKMFIEADFFICNDHKVDELRAKIARFLAIVFNSSIHTPMVSEAAMYKASSAAADSGCMSRQVGAAIVAQNGELISVGWNDVPKFGGGVYGENDQFLYDPSKKAIIDQDNRCFKWGGGICHNETRKDLILTKIAKRISESEIIKKGRTTRDVLELLRGTEIDSLIEFSRSIHAEMQAILSVAREARHSLINSTLYTNTYPCHNCARHIVAAGISHVVYIEPYDKSLAVALHHDAITEDPGEVEKVIFRQYDGVAPRNFLRLFRPSDERKKGGVVVKPLPKYAVPVLRVPLDAPEEYEAKVIADLSSKEQHLT